MLYLAAAAGFVILLLFVPIDLLFRAERRESTTSEITVSWLYGLVKKRFAPGQKGDGKAQEGIPAGRKRPGKRSWRRFFTTILGTPGFAGRLARLPADILRTFSIRSLDVQARLGFEDPAETGMACGALSAIAPGLRSIYPLDYSWEPDFTGKVFEGRAGGDLRIVPARTLWVLGRFALHPASIRAFRELTMEKGK